MSYFNKPQVWRVRFKQKNITAQDAIAKLGRGVLIHAILRDGTKIFVHGANEAVWDDTKFKSDIYVSFEDGNGQAGDEIGQGRLIYTVTFGGNIKNKDFSSYIEKGDLYTLSSMN